MQELAREKHMLTYTKAKVSLRQVEDDSIDKYSSFFINWTSKQITKCL